MELVILFIILLIIALFFKSAKNIIYALGIIEIFFHIMTFIKNNIGVKEISSLIGKYIPESILTILAKYSSGILYIVLCWCFLICMIWFLIYLLKYFFKGK